jgi:hypothetical protein
MARRLWSAALCVLLIGCGREADQPPRPDPASRPDFSGMWSDPPASAADQFCFITCTDAGITHLNALLDDPANDARPFGELSNEASRHQNETYIRPALAPEVARTFPLDPADDPGFLACEPWGVARQIVAPHQLEIRQFDDRIEMRYAEWDGRRTVYMDGRTRPPNQPASAMGYSVGRYEGNVLIIETSGISANLAGIFPAWFRHSDQLTIVERYTREADRNRLEFTATLTDPVSMRQPLQFRKAWGWAPDEQIFPYTDCQPPAEFKKVGAKP